MNNISINSISYAIKICLNNENFEQEKIGKINNFIYKNLRTILQQTETLESIDLQANLLELSNKINKELDTPKAHKLSFNIMGIALGLFSAKKNNYLQEEIPSDVFSIIVDNLNPRNLSSDIKFLKSIETTSKQWKKEINDHIFRRINEENLSLSIVGCNTGAEAIDYIIKNKLQSANLSVFDDITYENMNKLIENCPNLHTLFVESEFVESECTQLSSDKLAEALAKLTALKSLDLKECTQLSEDKLAEALAKLTALQSLNLAECTQLSGDKLIEALAKLTALQSLDLERCTQLSGDKLAEAIAKLTALQSLDLEGCTQLSGDKLAEALVKLTALQSLNLEGCTHLSGDKLAEAIAAKLTALHSLNLRGCTELRVIIL